MITVTYDGDLGKSLWAEFEIDYDYDSPEYMGGYRTCPGQLNVHRVRVLFVEGYSCNTSTMYAISRDKITPDWLPVLDGVAYNYVQSSVDNWDQLAEHLVECAQ